MTITLVTLLISLAFMIGIVLLQIYLSKKESKWPGLVLPLLSLCIAFIAVLSVAAFTMHTEAVLTVTDESGAVLQEEILTDAAVHTQTHQDIPSLISTIGIVFLLYNIPTIILLAIYFGCREKQNRRRKLDKMQVQDLE